MIPAKPFRKGGYHLKICHISTFEKSYCPTAADLDAYHSTPVPAAPAGEYPRIRIPGLVALNDGTLLAYAEYRQGNDWSAIDICMRKSADGGRTWSDRRLLVPGLGRNTCNNPVMFSDGDTVHFLYCMNYSRVFCCRSEDAGETWSAPIELTGSIDAQCGGFFWNCIALGPGHGTALSSGRLIVPIWLAYNRKDRFAHHPSVTSVLFSDDRGASWTLGPLLDGSDPNESVLAELPDGRLLLNLRNTAPEKCRYVSLSDDGGRSWTQPAFDKNLPDPGCAAGMCSAGGAVLFSNCESRTDRINLTLKKSTDGGKTWQSLPIEPLAGYSDVVYCAARRRAYVLFEHDSCREIRIAEIDVG